MVKSATRASPKVEQPGFPWLALLLVVSGITLVLQIFPGLWFGTLSILSATGSTILSIVDVRAWTWKAFASAFSLAIVVLFALRAWSAK